MHKTFSETIIQKLTWARAYHEAYKSRSMKRRFFYDLPPYQSSRLRNCEAVEWQTAKCPSLIPFRPRSFVDWLRSSRRAAVPVVVGKPDKIYIYVRARSFSRKVASRARLSVGFHLVFHRLYVAPLWYFIQIATDPQIQWAAREATSCYEQLSSRRSVDLNNRRGRHRT